MSSSLPEHTSGTLQNPDDSTTVDQSSETTTSPESPTEEATTANGSNAPFAADSPGGTEIPDNSDPTSPSEGQTGGLPPAAATEDSTEPSGNGDSGGRGSGDGKGGGDKGSGGGDDSDNPTDPDDPDNVDDENQPTNKLS